MAKVLYRAKDAEGRETEGFVDVASNGEALKKVTQKGLSDIRLFSDAALKISRDELEGLDEAQLRHIAKIELEAIEGAHDPGSYLRELAKKSLLPAAAGAAIGYYGYIEQSYLWMSFGTILAVAYPFFSLWYYTIAHRFESMIQAYTFGEWDRFGVHARKLLARTKKPEVVEEIHHRIACYEAMQGRLEKGLEICRKSEPFYRKQRQEIYHSRVAQVYACAGAYKEALEEIGKAYEISEANLLLAEWAQMESRFGSVEKAKALLAKVDRASIPHYGVGFLDFTEGLISARSGSREAAKKHLFAAYDAFAAYEKNPVVWSTIAMVVAYIALLLHSGEDRGEALRLLEPGIVRIITIHAPEAMCRALRMHYPEAFGDANRQSETDIEALSV